MRKLSGISGFRWLYRHTVTLDDGQWSSRELNMNGTYQHTFTRPGIYYYHCAVHLQEMRGTIIVK
jgi:plastocyanin